MVLMAALVWGLSSCNNDDDLDIIKFQQLRGQGSGSGSEQDPSGQGSSDESGASVYPTSIDLTTGTNEKSIELNTPSGTTSWRVDKLSYAFNFPEFSVSPMMGYGSGTIYIRQSGITDIENYTTAVQVLKINVGETTFNISVKGYVAQPMENFEFTPSLLDLTYSNQGTARINADNNLSWIIDSKSPAFSFPNFSVSPMSGMGSYDIAIKGLNPQYPECYNKVTKTLTAVSKDQSKSISIKSYEPNASAFKLSVENLLMGTYGEPKTTKVITYDTDSWQVNANSPALSDFAGLKVTPMNGTGPQTLTVIAPKISDITYYKPATKNLLITNGDVTRECAISFYEPTGDITVSPSSLFFAMSSETQKVRVTVADNDIWTVSSNSTIFEWSETEVLPRYGVGSGEISVTVKASGNVNSPIETGTLILMTGEKRVTVTVQRYKP